MIIKIINFALLFTLITGCDGALQTEILPSQSSFILTMGGIPGSSFFIHEQSTDTIEFSGGSGSGRVSWSISDPTVATVTVVGNQATITPLKSGTVFLSVTKESDGTYAQQMRVYPVTVSYLVGNTWTRTTADVAGGIHSGRKNFVSFSDNNNTLWVMGGVNASDTTLDDIWKSTDGVSWTQVIPSSGYWSARSQFSGVVTSGSDLWVMGGYDGESQQNDVWKSSNKGQTWTKISEGSSTEVQNGTHWSARDDHIALAGNNGTLWILGGFSNSVRLNDIWKSTDGGQSWMEVVPGSSHWSPRSNHAGFISGDELWILGGNTGSGFTNDIWKSENDGETWIKIDTSGGQWSARELHKAFASPLTGIIWVLGGYDGNRKGDIWKSYDRGLTWTQISVSGSYWSTRDRFDSFISTDGFTLWLIGGVDSGNTVYDDVWKSQ